MSGDVRRSGPSCAQRELEIETKKSERLKYRTAEMVGSSNCNSDLCTTTKGVQQRTLGASREGMHRGASDAQRSGEPMHERFQYTKQENIYNDKTCTEKGICDDKRGVMIAMTTGSPAG